MATSPGTMALIGGLFAWSIYRRIRRNIGRQKLKPVRSIISLIILSLISAWILSLGANNPNLLLGFGGGLLLGGALGIVGLRLTKFETTEEGHFYTPNTHIGIALSILFIGRLAYKYLTAGHTINPAAQGPTAAFQSPLTVLIMGLTVGYYIVYQIGVLIHNRDKRDAAETTPPPPAQP